MSAVKERFVNNLPEDFDLTDGFVFDLEKDQPFYHNNQMEVQNGEWDKSCKRLRGHQTPVEHNGLWEVWDALSSFYRRNGKTYK